MESRHVARGERDERCLSKREQILLSRSALGQHLFIRRKHDNFILLKKKKLTVFLRSTDRLHASHDGLAVGVTGRHKGFSKDSPCTAAHLQA